MRRSETNRRARPPSGQRRIRSPRVQVVDQRLEKLEVTLRELKDQLETVEHRLGGVARTAREGAAVSKEVKARLDRMAARLDALEAGNKTRGRTRRTPRPAANVTQIAEKVALQAIQPVMKAIDERIEKLQAPEAPEGFSPQRFKALAREVKQLKQSVRVPALNAGASPELIGLLNSPEFKQVFDKKIKPILDYLESDVIPRVVTRALRGK